ncbi:MAG: thiol-disulfide oxidoreductase DCC family protein [Saprospiraceae bacterium]
MATIKEIDELSTKHPILLFDGVCNLCNHYVQFVIERDPAARFRFASLQSDTGQTILAEKKLSKALGTVVLLDDKKVYTHSDVALQMTLHLGGWWKMLYGFVIIPKFMRDGIYNLIADNRYRLYGKKESCMLPSPALKTRFLDV